MSKIIGVTVGTPISPKKLSEKLSPVKTVNGKSPDANGNVKVDTAEGMTLGVHTDGLIYLFKNGVPQGVGLEIKAEEIEGGDVVGYIDGNNNIVVKGNLADGTYSVKYEMEDGSFVSIGNLVLDSNVYYTVSKTLTNCTINNNATKVVAGGSFAATITANSGYTLSSVTVTMGGSPVSVSNGVINIANVTGDIAITASAVASGGNSGGDTGSNLADPTSFMIDHRISTSTGEPKSGCTGHIVTNHIRANAGDTLYVEGLDITKVVSSQHGVVAAYSGESKTYNGYYAFTGRTQSEGYDYGAKNKVSTNGNVQIYTLLLLDDGTQRAPSDMMYIRLDGTLMDGYTANDVKITINHPIS